MPGRTRNCLRLILAGILGLMLVACTGPSKEEGQASEVKRPVWPKPPAQARIEFVRSITSPEDVGIEPGFWSRLASIFVGREEVRLVRPTSVVGIDGEMLFVADPGSKIVHRFDVRDNDYRALKPAEGGAFRSPISLAVDPTERVYVSDSALDRIFIMERDSEAALPFNTDVELQQPTGLAFDAARDRLYVVNTRKHQILAFNRQGESVIAFGSRGAGAGQFNYPTQIWCDPSTGELWVTDSLNFRIQHFSPEGEYLSSFSGVGDGTGNMARPKGVATDSAGHVYIVDGLFNNLQIFNLSGELLLYLGRQGRGIGQFWLPVGIFIDRQNRIYVADSYNNRVQVFRFLENKG